MRMTMENEIKRRTAKRKAAHPSFGHRTVAGLLKMNKNTVQRIFQLKGWPVKKRQIGFRPHVQTMSSAVPRPNQRRASNLCRIRAGNDGWRYRALMIDCCFRKLPGWHLSR